ncbi:MAG TPA: glycosyltransferase family 4 protein [Vicinamibacterales bacterium]|nr:glycosyltransferase family 4 protein [Vicinamibacterales bacterium]
MAVEQSQCAPDGVVYSFLTPTQLKPRVIRSPIKAYMRSYDMRDVDVVEAIISPLMTDRPWIYSCENLQAAAAFSLAGIPLPRSARVRFIRHLLMKTNCKKVVFWSRAGLETLASYGGLDTRDDLFQKATVVYPAVRRMPDHLVRFSDQDITLLFSGDFFRKGGVNVVDAFERASRKYPNLRLILCCDDTSDFNSPNTALRDEYLRKVHSLDRIEFLGRVPRKRMIEELLPRTDIYLLPTYAETFGMSILEAMAFGIPVVATNHFAIPEMVAHGECGFLIDIARWDTERLFKGYVVDILPTDFRSYVTERLFEYVCELADSRDLRQRLGMAALSCARTRFSFEVRNAVMGKVYLEAVQ